MKTLRLLFLSATIPMLMACGKGGGGGDGAVAAAAVNSVSPLIGQTYFFEVLKSGSPYYSVFKVADPANIKIMEIYFKSSVSAVGYYRKSVGTYAVSGSTINLTYSYETCNPVHSESVTVNYTDASNSLTVTQSGTILQYMNLAKWAPSDNINAVGLVEDTGCNQIP